MQRAQEKGRVPRFHCTALTINDIAPKVTELGRRSGASIESAAHHLQTHKTIHLFGPNDAGPLSKQCIGGISMMHT